MHMLEMHGGPEHLVVFITSDQDFCEKIQELQRRNFKVVVLYHGPSASSKPASITQVADESHDWLTFLKQELGLPLLSFVPYNPQVYRGAHQAQNVGLAARTASTLSRQASQESRHTGRVSVLASHAPYCVSTMSLGIYGSCVWLTSLVVLLTAIHECLILGSVRCPDEGISCCSSRHITCRQTHHEPLHDETCLYNLRLMLAAQQCQLFHA